MVRQKIIPLVALGALAAPVDAVADDAAAAKEAYVTASRFFAAEEFEAALPLFDEAYRLSDRRPVTILGLAQCERSLKRYDDAIVHFREYLETDPEDAAEVKETIALLEDLVGLQRAAAAKRRQEAKARAKEPPATAPPPPAPVAPGEMNVEEAPLELSAEAPLPAVEPPPPPPAATPALATPAPVEPEDEGGVLSSPWFWVVTGVVVAGGAAAGGVLLAQQAGGSPAYGGTSGVVLGP